MLGPLGAALASLDAEGRVAVFDRFPRFAKGRYGSIAVSRERKRTTQSCRWRRAVHGQKQPFRLYRSWRFCVFKQLLVLIG